VVEKLVELRPYHGGLKITAGKRKSPKPLKTKGFGLWYESSLRTLNEEIKW